MKLFAVAAILAFALSAAAQTVTIPDAQGPIVHSLPPPPQPLPQQPNAPPRLDTFGDKASRCVHYGTSIGVPAGQIGQYTRDCVNR